MCNRETIFVDDGLIAFSSYANYAAAVKKQSRHDMLHLNLYRLLIMGKWHDNSRQRLSFEEIAKYILGNICLSC